MPSPAFYNMTDLTDLPNLSLAYSPCPNDTWVYGPLAVRETRPAGLNLTPYLHDVETLNELALQGRYDISKVSCQTYLHIQDQYRLLETGAALGFACGPLLIAKSHRSLPDLKEARIAIPGRLTTAYALFKMAVPEAGSCLFTTYDQIVSLLLNDEADYGVIIHESRFTYQMAGLECVIDLGAFWHQTTQLPLPLGCVVMKHEYYETYGAVFERTIQQILQQPDRSKAVWDYVKFHAQELSPEVLEAHIQLYVNDYTRQLGTVGHRALEVLAQYSLTEAIAE